MTLDIMIYAALAAFLLYRLYLVVGTQAESRGQSTQGPFPSPSSLAKKPDPEERNGAGAEIRPELDLPREIADALGRLRALEPGFDESQFLRRAELAFAMIIEAFAKGNRPLLQDLLSAELLPVFLTAIQEREARGETLDQAVRKVREVDFAMAEVSPALARLEVRFVSEQVSVLRDASGAVLDGDADLSRTVTDLWLFERVPGATDPAWRLARTR